MNDVFASLTDGGSIAVEEWPAGDLEQAAKRASDEGVLLLEISEDSVGGAPTDRVSLHPDESNRLALIDRGIQALENARDALKACGYVDFDARQGADA